MHEIKVANSATTYVLYIGIYISIVTQLHSQQKIWGKKQFPHQL